MGQQFSVWGSFGAQVNLTRLNTCKVPNNDTIVLLDLDNTATQDREEMVTEPQLCLSRCVCWDDRRGGRPQPLYVVYYKHCRGVSPECGRVLTAIAHYTRVNSKVQKQRNVCEQ